MKRAIYVGDDFEELRYGMTGLIRAWSGLFWSFYPDSDLEPGSHPWLMSRIVVAGKSIYIPSEDQASHRPKP